MFYKENLLRILGLIQILIVTFSEQPPVYSKPKGQEQPQQQPQSSALPYPAYPQNVYPSTGPGFVFKSNLD